MEGLSIFRLPAALWQAGTEPPAALDFLSRRFTCLWPLQSPGRWPWAGLVHLRGSGEGGKESEGRDEYQGETSHVSCSHSAR